MADAPRAEKFKPLEDLPDTGTIADSGDRFRNLNPSLVAGPEDAPKDPQSWSDWVKTGWSSETYDASRADQRGDRLDFDEIKIRDGYQPIVDALGLGGDQNPAGFSDTTVKGEPILRSSTLLRQQGKGWLEAMTNRSTQEELIAAEIRARRAKDPKFLAGVPDTVAGLRAYFQQQEDEKRKTARAKLEAAPTGLGSLVSDFAGRAVESMHDPINIVTLPVGGGGKTGMQILGREILVNGGLELLQQPFVAQNRQEFGEELTLGEAATNVVTAGIAGGVLETGFHYGGKGIAAANRAAGDPVSKAFAKVNEQLLATAARVMRPGETPIDAFGEIGNRELVDFIKRQSGGNLTPDEQAAANILIRDEEIGDTSPFEHGPDGEAAHEGKLEDTINDLIANRRPQDPSPADGAGAPPSAPGRPPAEASTAARRPQAPSGPASLPMHIVDGLKARGIPDHIARGAAAGVHAESRANASIVNPTSGAFGIGQWLGSRKAELFKRYGRAPSIDQQLDFLAWELKGGDHGGAKVLGAKDEVEALNAYIRDFMRPAAGRETDGDLQRGMAALGRGGESVPAGGSSSSLEFADVGEDPAIARLRAEAANLDDAVIGTTNIPGAGNVPLYSRRIPASEALVDAARFQFKSGGDAEGVIDTLRGVKQWDPMSAGRMVFWQDNEGRYFVADGHQRSGLARRLEAEGHAPIGLDGVVLREADGITAEQARAASALVNIRNGSGSRVDAAKVLRDLGFDTDLNLPPRSAFARDARGLAQLADDAFGAVVNERIAADIAAVVGRVLPDQPELHGGMIDILARLDPSNVGQAESIVRDALNAGVHSEEQIDLFGTSSSSRPLLLERAKIKERALGELRKMRVVHSTAAKNSGELEAKGSKIARAASEKEAKANAEAAEILDRLVNRAGPVSDALNTAAAKLAGGGKLADVAAEFVAEVRKLDLQALARGAEGDGGSVHIADGSGRGGDAGEAGEAAPDEQPSLGDLLGATERFSDPDGPAVKQQADSLVHDLKTEQATRDAFELERNSGFLVGLHAILDGGESGTLGRFHWERRSDQGGEWISVTDPSSGDPGDSGDDIGHLLTKGLELVKSGKVADDLKPELDRIVAAAEALSARRQQLADDVQSLIPQHGSAKRPPTGEQILEGLKLGITGGYLGNYTGMLRELEARTGVKADASNVDQLAAEIYALDKGRGIGHRASEDWIASHKAAAPAKLDPAARREAIRAATEQLKDVKPGELRAVEPFPQDEPGYHRFRYVAEDGTAVGGNYTLDGGPPPFIEGFNVGDTNNPVKLGAKQTRAMFEQLKAQHPEATRIHAFRMTGARAEAGSGPKEIWIDLTGKGEGVQPEAVDVHAGEPPEADGLAGEADISKMIADGADTRGMGVQLHGARGEVPNLTEGYYNPDNIYGGFETFYTTDAADIAGGYRRKNSDGRIYQAVERAPVKIFDMEQELPVEQLARLFGSKPDDFGLVPMAIEEAAKDGRAKVREVMDEIRGFSREEGYSKNDVQEIFDTAVTNLKEQGFGGMTHIGGLRTGRDPHTVKIYFDAPNQLELRDVTPAKAEASAPARSDSLSRTASWVIREKKTGRVMMETFDPQKLHALNTEKYEAVPIAEHLASLNAPNKAPGEAMLHADNPNVDPAIADKQRQELQLRAASPLRPGAVDAKGEIGLPMFDKADQITFRLDEEGGEISAADLLAEIEADDKAIQTLKGCL